MRQLGEKIREGKNGAVTSNFPTPEEIGNGLVGSDGVNYVVKAKNLADIKCRGIKCISSQKQI